MEVKDKEVSDFKERQIIENQIKTATRIMKGKASDRDNIGWKDVAMVYKLSIQSMLGDKEARYQLYQLKRELNEVTIKRDLESLDNITEMHSSAILEDNILKELAIKGVANLSKLYIKRCIKGTLKSIKVNRNKMGRLAKKLGKEEVFESKLNVDELTKQYL